MYRNVPIKREPDLRAEEGSLYKPVGLGERDRLRNAISSIASAAAS
jgi:hypothetical protein